MIGALFCLSYVVITGFVGQMSLVQVALGGRARFTVSKLALHAGIGFPLGALIGTLAAVAFGLVTAVSALRVRGVQLAVVTMAAAVAIESFGFSNPSWGAGPAGSPVPTPNLLGVGLGTQCGLLSGRWPAAQPGVRVRMPGRRRRRWR